LTIQVGTKTREKRGYLENESTQERARARIRGQSDTGWARGNQPPTGSDKRRAHKGPQTGAKR